MDEKNQNLKQYDIEKIIEALLFIAPSPVSASQLGEAIGIKAKEVEAALKNYGDRLSQTSALRLQFFNDKYQLTTAPEISSTIELFLGLDSTTKLSKAALETLAIIAYRQPLTRPGVDAIRGVNSDGVLRSLLSKGLVQEVGRSDGPGRPILYGTTSDFLQHFGFSSLDEMPPYIDEEEELRNQEANQLFKD
jgi:segregation and condensation protein B